MKRRDFIKTTSAIGGAAIVGSAYGMDPAMMDETFSFADAPWFDKSMLWAQLAFVENDPGQFDPISGLIISRKFMPMAHS